MSIVRAVIPCRACEIRDCPRHCVGCGYAVAHHPENCLNSRYWAAWVELRPVTPEAGREGADG